MHCKVLYIRVLKGTMSEAELYTLRQRLNAGRLSKVQRGEYVQHLPTGFVRLSNQEVIKDPDAQVQHVIELVFTQFTELGSACKVMRYCRDHAILLPRHQTSGFHQGELLWKKPSDSAIREILTNPAYAGAFVYGRRPKDPTRRQPGRHSTGVVRKPLEDWLCIIPDRYPAYISWEQYLANQVRLRDNGQRYQEQWGEGRGAPGRGPALLQGLATCGQCGRRMAVTYKPGVRYVCKAMPNTFGEPMCAHLDGPSIETFVVQAFFEAIAPAQLDALEDVLQQQYQERQRLERYHQQQTQRAQYEATLARRRYEQVDPDNRLVAAALEQQWEEKLQGLREAQEAAERFACQLTEPGVSPELRQQLSDLNGQLPQLWESDQLTNEQRKQLLRSLISRVILKRIASDQVQVRIVWVSGHFSEGQVNPPVYQQTQVTGYSTMVERIKQLWQAGQTDLQIAQTLSEEGFRSARHPHLLPKTVLKV
ncbi:MAG TPA: recombinase family protein, partial [Allocoleopsis sp.]